MAIGTFFLFFRITQDITYCSNNTLIVSQFISMYCLVVLHFVQWTDIQYLTTPQCWKRYIMSQTLEKLATHLSLFLPITYLQVFTEGKNSLAVRLMDEGQIVRISSTSAEIIVKELQTAMSRWHNQQPVKWSCDCHVTRFCSESVPVWEETRTQGCPRYIFEPLVFESG